MNEEIYQKAKNEFLNGKSIRSVSRDFNINRKKFSMLLKNDGIYTDKKISNKQMGKAIKLYKNDYSLSYIAKELQVDRHTLSKELDRRGIKKNNKYSKPKQYRKIIKYDNEIIKKYNNGCSIQAIADDLNTSTNVVWNCLLEYDLVNSNNTSRIYDINENRFLKISTEEEAYWLGFLYGDGYVDEQNGRISLCLKEQDKYHIESFIDFIGSNISGYYKLVNGHMQYRVDINSRKVVNNLVKLGCMQCKTTKLKFPHYNELPKSLQRHFIRGFFDADGCACISGGNFYFGLVGACEEFITKIHNILVSELGINDTKICVASRNGIPLYNTQNTAKKDILKIYNYLYKDSTVSLDRKKYKFEIYLKNKKLI